MIFSNFSRIEEAGIILFSTKTPIEYVEKIKYYKDDEFGSFTKKEFRWSFNQTYWSSWEVLNQGNISNIKTRNNQYLFLQVRYVKSNDSSSVTFFSVSYNPLSEAERVQVSEDITVEPSTIPSDYSGSGSPIYTATPINAELLCGKPCDYYLWRKNHKGEQPISSITDLELTLDNLAASIQAADIAGADNVDSSLGVGVFYENFNKILYFRRIVGGDGINVNGSGLINLSVDLNYIKTDSSIIELYNFYSALENDLQDLSIYVDSTFTTINSSISDLYSITVDLDNSISELNTRLGTYFMRDASNIGGGEGEIFKTIDSSGVALFRTITGSGDVSISTIGDNVNVYVKKDVDVSIFNPWQDPDPISADVGGLNSGDKIDIGNTPRDVLEKILYEYFPPTINLSLSPTSDVYYEKWIDAPTVDISGNFNNEKFTKVRVYEAELYINSTSNPGLPPITYSDVSSGNFYWNDTAPPYGATWDNVTYTVTLLNKVNGINMENANDSASIKFVNPYYYGVVSDSVDISNITQSDITNLTKLLVPQQTNSLEYSVPSNTKIKFVYAYPEEYSDLKSIFDVKNDFNVTTSFDKTTVNFNGVGASPSPIPYKVYIKNHWISFTPDVSLFKLIFNI